ncbi:MAG: Eco57I restriction-modification methylase domain-containing protein [Corallococcus sp.]|nr:Eco57I restriction-modification methylase domain-containing protein [Corallococcus sp.]
MKFDVIISNPPYQLSDGGAQASAKPIYQLFVNAAKKLKPKYLTMIIPSRWMTGGKGLDEFRNEMIHDRHISKLHDFIDSKECFSGVDIKGGVCYFLWDRDKSGMCDITTHTANEILNSTRYLCDDNDNIFVRDCRMISIKNKVAALNEKTFADIVSSRKPYGLSSDFFKNPQKFGLPSLSDKPIDGGYSILGLENLKRVTKYIPKNYPLPKNDGLNKYKVFISNSYGCGAIGEVPATPVLATPGELCTETFLEIGPFDTRLEAENCLSYIKTKFLRLLVGIRKMTQHATKEVYKYVPMQDFHIEWNDEMLYQKYNLTQDEINYIENVIIPME